MTSLYSVDTEVKTNNGWKYFQDVEDYDAICTLGVNSRLIDYVNFDNRIERYVDDYLLHYGNRRFDFLVAPDHLMWAHLRGNPVLISPNGSEKLVPANRVKKSYQGLHRGFTWHGKQCDYFVLPAVEQREQYSRAWVHVPARHINLGDWLEFFGMWLADGSVRLGLNIQGNPRYTVTIKQSEGNDAYLRGLYDAIGFECKRESMKSGNHNYTVYSKQLWTYLRQFGQSRDKYIPRWILQLDGSLLRRLWDGYVAGDSQVTAKEVVLSSVSKQLLVDIQEVALKVFGRIIQVRDVHAVYRDQPYLYYISQFSLSQRVRYFKYGEPTKVDYQGFVRGLSLSDDRVMLVRRNDKIAWSG